MGFLKRTLAAGLTGGVSEVLIHTMGPRHRDRRRSKYALSEQQRQTALLERIAGPAPGAIQASDDQWAREDAWARFES